ncbi:hypothetical protein DIJ64_06560 [Mycobacterium leprae]|uniref:Uncharacterized protein n=1 Tax=Mycobacterium leprae TaxID=1769 RepID=A0AAD0KQP5_MYCLR|nr:hypothetical protein [Mycobacterium leprae]AWV47848.1 hypothetical protein DIJ64_06560 [Mycobacterium leprae]OAR20356.1 hypothetical protein A8144_11225 [Mycobacterium leprae 3125609]OAX70633.1 hypothetical protein A3216_10745 [Mycobacterium leprae 7935681]
MLIDYLYGLSNPYRYLHCCKELLGTNAWIVIEKILAVDEALVNLVVDYDEEQHEIMMRHNQFVISTNLGIDARLYRSM